MMMAPARRLAELKPHDGEHRDQSIAQGVPVDDRAAPSIPWPGRCAHSPRAKHFEHGGACQPGQDGGADDAQPRKLAAAGP